MPAAACTACAQAPIPPDALPGSGRQTHSTRRNLTAKDAMFGTRAHQKSLANIHDHLSSWKVDLDVLGASNSFHKSVRPSHSSSPAVGPGFPGEPCTGSSCRRRQHSSALPATSCRAQPPAAVCASSAASWQPAALAAVSCLTSRCLWQASAPAAPPARAPAQAGTARAGHQGGHLRRDLRPRQHARLLLPRRRLQVRPACRLHALPGLS